jgi:DNA-binding transcriptional ArsR family regulator
MQALDDATAAGRFKALADPTRIAIVNRLACCDECT